MDDTEVEANEQMIRNVGVRKEGGKRKRESFFFLSMPDGRAVGTSLITVGIDFPLSHQHTYNHTNKHMHTHAELPPVTRYHLPGTWSSKQDQGGLLSLVEGERIRPMEKEWKGTNAICFHFWFLQFSINA